MSTNSSIEWTETTWNPVAGCSIVSPGCTNCYAMRMAHRLEAMGQAKYAGLTKKVNGLAVWTGKINLDEKALLQPLTWKKPRRVFVNSMSDLFHPDVPSDFIRSVFDVMWQTDHIYQVLTKRPETMAHVVDWLLQPALTDKMLENIWLGTSVEDRKRKTRIDDLRDCRAIVRFLSCEPLLEDLGELDLTGIHWVIVGGESGPGSRPMNVGWARSIVLQCKAAGVACFVKQFGARPYSDDGSDDINAGNALLLRDGKGGDPNEWPEDLRVREFPQTAAVA